jgi:hypothetical protein
MQYSIWVQGLDAYPTTEEGRIKGRTVRFGWAVVFAQLSAGFCTAQRIRAPCAFISTL